MKQKLYRPSKNTLTTGFRLALASGVFILGKTFYFMNPALVFACIVLAGVIMSFPSFSGNRGRLATGAQTEEEKKAFFDEVEKLVKKIVAESQKDDPNTSKVDKFVKEFNEKVNKLSETELKTLKDSFDKLSKDYENVVEENKKIMKSLGEQSAEIKKLKDNGAENEDTKKNRALSIREAIKQAIYSHPKKDQIVKTIKDSDTPEGRDSIAEYIKAEGKTPVFTVKALVDMFVSNIADASVPDLRLTALDPNRVSIPLSVFTHVINVFSSKPIARPYMALLVVYEYEDGAGVKLEGAASVKSSFKLKTVKFPAFYIATHYVLSDETLDDLDEVMDEISMVAPDKIQSAIDAQIIRTGGDDVTSIKGILHADKSTAYVQQLAANSVDGAYIVDVIADAILQAEYAGYIPNVVMLNPKDIAKLAAKKNNMDDSKSDRRVTYGTNGVPTYVCGLLISKCKDIVENTILVLDNKQPWIGKRKELTFEIGYSGTQFVEGEKTAKLSVRIAFGVRDKAGVIYVSDVDAAAAALLKA